jgi:hypothetical protein
VSGAAQRYAVEITLGARLWSFVSSLLWVGCGMGTTIRRTDAQAALVML